MSDQTSKAKEIKLRNESEWFRINGVTAVGLGRVNEDIGIIISVEQNTPEVQMQIPSSIEGIPIKIQATGKFRAH